MFKYLLLIATFSINSAMATPAFDGKKAINLIDIQGREITIGHIEFTSSDNSTTYHLDIDHSVFKDFFLSMKEMKCLEGPELWCHLAYPYQTPQTITRQDLRWLSHDLLFMYKKKSEFGANFYQGIYYQLTVKENSITGIAQAVDLNMLAAPPDDLSVPPITVHDLDEIEPTNRWLTQLIIK